MEDLQVYYCNGRTRRGFRTAAVGYISGGFVKPYYEEAGITIYHGDCRDVISSIDFSVTVTDPPYGVNLGAYTGTSRYLNTPYACIDDTPEFVATVCVPAIEMCLAKSSQLAMTPGNKCMFLYPRPDDIGVWYNPASTNRGKWGFSHVNAFIYFYGKDPHNVGKGMIPNSISGHCDSVEGIAHPCPKPLKFARWLVGRTSTKNDTVLDPFMGSGTTLLAAKNWGRPAIGVELEERYCEI